MNNFEIKKVLSQFKDGYAKRDLNEVESFVEQLFIMRDDTCVLGTGTDELFLGIEEIKTLIKNDWEFWGDVNIDLESLQVDNKNEVAWFATTGTVRYTFLDTPERYDNYLKLIKNKIKESELTAKQKITFINWILALTYHQRVDGEREYLWPLRLSGVLLKDNDKWKFTHMQFSIPKANFPDERFENSKEFIQSFKDQNAMLGEQFDTKMDTEIKLLLENLEKELFGRKNISEELLCKYFSADNIPYIIGAESKWYTGVEQIREFFDNNSDITLKLDLEHAITSKQGEVTWITVCGLLKENLSEDEAITRVFHEFEGLLESEISAKDKLFSIHRSIAYALKESAMGESYTCPIRITAVILNELGKPVFQNMHISFPFYWILEGKLDSI